jgi:hypothetical protein
MLKKVLCFFYGCFFCLSSLSSSCTKKSVASFWLVQTVFAFLLYFVFITISFSGDLPRFHNILSSNHYILVRTGLHLFQNVIGTIEKFDFNTAVSVAISYLAKFGAATAM